MSYYTVTVSSEDGQAEVSTYETDSETLACVQAIIKELQSLDNGERLEVTVDIF